jgi:signal transduction histidine kinase
MSGEQDPLQSGPLILIVDDHPNNLVALEALLEPLDCRVIRAETGVAAVERSRDAVFAAIIMDVRMPGLDGFATASFIRQDPRLLGTPILFVTAHDDIDIAELTRMYGVTGHVDALPKPFDPEALCSKIRWWVELFRKGLQVHELERAVDAARAQARTKDDIMAMVAHDLKGPLTALRLDMHRLRDDMADDARDSKNGSSVRRRFDRASRNVDAMTRIVDDLLDSARIESGTLRMDLAEHAFEPIVTQAVELLQPLAEQKGIRLAASVGRAGTVLCDRDRMLQVFSNLIGNAIKFTPAGGRVDVDVTGSTDAVVVCVRDTGPGIAPDDLPHLFQKYWQSNRQAHPSGIGLGLVIAKEIVVAHQGRIWADSQPGDGSRFFLSIPRAPLVHSVARPTETRHAE